MTRCIPLAFPAARFTPYDELPVLACQSGTERRWRAAALAATALAAWTAAAGAAAGGDGLGRLEWSVPVSYFQPCREAARPMLHVPLGLLAADEPVAELAERYPGSIRLVAPQLLSAAPELFFQRSDSEAETSAFAHWCTMASWSTGPADVCDASGSSGPFDADRRERFLDEPLIDSAPSARANCRFDAAQPRDGSESPRSIGPFLAVPTSMLGPGDGANARPGYEHFTLEPLYPRALAPSGAMFLWRLEAGTPDPGTTPYSQITRMATSTGVVLNRSPGVYSLDWVGVAVAAPIH